MDFPFNTQVGGRGGRNSGILVREQRVEDMTLDTRLFWLREDIRSNEAFQITNDGITRNRAIQAVAFPGAAFGGTHFLHDEQFCQDLLQQMKSKTVEARECLRLATEASDLLSKKTVCSMLNVSLMNIAHFFETKKQYPAPLSYYHEAVRMSLVPFEEDNSYIDRSTPMLNLGLCYKRAGFLDKAQYWYTEVSQYIPPGSAGYRDLQNNQRYLDRAKREERSRRTSTTTPTTTNGLAQCCWWCGKSDAHHRSRGSTLKRCTLCTARVDVAPAERTTAAGAGSAGTTSSRNDEEYMLYRAHMISIAHYCDRDCQKRDWKFIHKEVFHSE